MTCQHHRNSHNLDLKPIPKPDSTIVTKQGDPPNTLCTPKGWVCTGGTRWKRGGCFSVHACPHKRHSIPWTSIYTKSRRKIGAVQICMCPISCSIFVNKSITNEPQEETVALLLISCWPNSPVTLLEAAALVSIIVKGWTVIPKDCLRPAKS